LNKYFPRKQTIGKKTGFFKKKRELKLTGFNKNVRLITEKATCKRLHWRRITQNPMGFNR